MSFFLRPAAENVARRSAAQIVGLGVKAGVGPYGMNSSTAVSPPEAILQSAEITTNGIGQLSRATIQLKAFNAVQFTEMYNRLVRPGSVFTIYYGRPGGSSRSKTFRTFNFDFKITKLGGYDVTVKGVGGFRGEDSAPWTDFNVLRTDLLPNWKVYGKADEVRFSSSDIVKYMFIQVMTKNIEEHGESYGKLNSGNSGTVGSDDLSWKFFNVMGSDPVRDFDPPNTTTGGIVSKPPGADGPVPRPMQYYTLDAICKVVNRFVLYDTSYQITTSNGDWDHNQDCRFSLGDVSNKNLVPPDPYNVMYNFSRGTNIRYVNQKKLGGLWWFAPARVALEAYMSIDGSTVEYDPSNILISELQLSNIISSVKQQAQDTNVTQEKTEDNLAEMKLSDFFEKIFAVIKKDTGGIVDLTLDVSDYNPYDILIVNKQRDPGTVTDTITLSVPDGTYGIRDIKLNGKVPKSLQAKMFGEAPDTTSTSKALVTADTRLVYTRPEPPTAELEDILNAIGDEFCQGASVSSARAYNNTWGTYMKDKLPQIEPSPLPLDLGFTVDGGTEIGFGNPVTIEGLPGFLTGNDNVFWTVTEVTEKIQGNDWTTEVKTVARMRPAT